MEKQNGNEINEKFLDFANFSEFFDNLSANVKDTIQQSNRLASNPQDFDYYLTYPDFKKCLKRQNDRILKLMGTILKHECGKKSSNIFMNRDNEDKTRLLIDSNDQLIEKLGTQLDIIEGLRKKTEVELKISNLVPTTRNIKTSWNKDIGMVVNRPVDKIHHISHKVLIKPQIYFTDKIDNTLIPFVPKLRIKPNSIKELPEIFTKLDEIEINEELFEKNQILLENPYSHEIDNFLIPNEYLTENEPKQYGSLDDTNYEYIDTIEALNELQNYLQDRSKVQEIAVDLEHHSYRSYQGFTCLMQISTREKDFIIDTIKLRSSIHILNKIFTDSSLIKIFHGADMDIEWLQKDFGIYVVNMFDTGQASRLLNYQHFSLSFLLKKFCNITANKQYQLSDWRVRPLSIEQLKYAREDTHYLLFIYDNLRNELINKTKEQLDLDKSLLQLTHEYSQLKCKKIYRKPQFNAKNFLNEHKEHLNAKQLKALQSLLEWRDRIARESDESCEYVLKNHQLLKIAELLPREIHGILALCNPISHIVESKLHDIHALIMEAREFIPENSTIEEQSIFNDIQKFSTFIHLPSYDPTTTLNNPHDFTHSRDENKPLSVDSNANLKDMLIKPNELKCEFILKQSKFNGVFETTSKSYKKINEKVNKIKETMLNPFEIYLPAKLRPSAVIDESRKWCLIENNDLKEVKKEEKYKQELKKTPKPAAVDLIPLAAYKKTEQIEKGIIKKTKKAKLDMTDAIEEANNLKRKKPDTLGDTNEEENMEAEEAISKNLSKIAESVRTNQPFNYEQVDLNQIFDKSSTQPKKLYDPTSKVRNIKVGRVSKKSKASMRRSNNNKMATFKK